MDKTESDVEGQENPGELESRTITQNASAANLNGKSTMKTSRANTRGEETPSESRSPAKKKKDGMTPSGSVGNLKPTSEKSGKEEKRSKNKSPDREREREGKEKKKDRRGTSRDESVSLEYSNHPDFCRLKSNGHVKGVVVTTLKDFHKNSHLSSCFGSISRRAPDT